jgi:23S rRNA (cytidine1920-2'-O)/16S rRNA (cytidine1409-2'-O)-methyltransferase
MERTHAARLDPEDQEPVSLPERVSLAVADVSFISLTRLLRGMAAHVSPGGDMLPMVKPQFELSPADVPKGVVRDPAARARAVARVREHAERLGLAVVAEVPSSLVGPSGNQEFFLHLRLPAGAPA